MRTRFHDIHPTTLRTRSYDWKRHSTTSTIISRGRADWIREEFDITELDAPQILTHRPEIKSHPNQRACTWGESLTCI